MADAIASILILSALFALWVGPWRDAWTSWARQRMFECRDELFDMGANGELEFNSKEYRTIRAALEKTIRFAHELTVWRLIFLWNAAPSDYEGKSDLNDAMEHIRNPVVRAKVIALINRKNWAVVWMILAKSPVSVFLLVFVRLSYRVLRRCFRVSLTPATAQRVVTREADHWAEVAQLEAEAVYA